MNFSESWYLPFHLDIGTGDSDLTWQAMAGIGYRFSKIDIGAGYRYLEWELENRKVLGNLELKGPFVGIKFRF